MITKAKAIETGMGELKAAEALVQEKTVEGIKQGTQAAVAGAEQVQAQLQDGVKRAMKTAEQMTSFSQGNIEAMMKSSQILATGLTDFSRMFAATARANLDHTMSTFKAMSSVKSVKEAMDLQSSFAKSALETAMADSSKLTEQSMKLAEQAFAPITARVNAAVETFS